jgi:hypothetical protein
MGESGAGRAAPGGPVYIDGETVRRLTPMPTLMNALRTAFSRGVPSPPRHHHHLPSAATLLLMPAWSEAGNAGVKLVVVQPRARPAVQAT